jgi:hypothetical protein
VGPGRRTVGDAAGRCCHDRDAYEVAVLARTPGAVSVGQPRRPQRREAAPPFADRVDRDGQLSGDLRVGPALRGGQYDPCPHRVADGRFRGDGGPLQQRSHLRCQFHRHCPDRTVDLLVPAHSR